jgi:hypothetical protein
MNTNNIHYIAGLLEGEACFRLINKKTPAIVIKMTDRDVINKVKAIFKTDNFYVEDNGRMNANWRVVYVTNVSGIKAVQWMMTIYPLMGLRRQIKIREIIMAWKGKSGEPAPSNAASVVE